MSSQSEKKSAILVNGLIQNEITFKDFICSSIEKRREIKKSLKANPDELRGVPKFIDNSSSPLNINQMFGATISCERGPLK